MMMVLMVLMGHEDFKMLTHLLLAKGTKNGANFLDFLLVLPYYT